MQPHDDIHARLGRIERVLLELKEDIGILKGKAAIWGMLGGAIIGSVIAWAT